MFKKYMKKVLAFTLAGALAFSGAQIASIGGADVASATAADHFNTSAALTLDTSSATIASVKNENLTIGATTYTAGASLAPGYLFVTPGSTATLEVNNDDGWNTASIKPTVLAAPDGWTVTPAEITSGDTKALISVKASSTAASTDINAGPNLIVKIKNDYVRIIATNSNYSQLISGKDSIDLSSAETGLTMATVIGSTKANLSGFSAGKVKADAALAAGITVKNGSTELTMTDEQTYTGSDTVAVKASAAGTSGNLTFSVAKSKVEFAGTTGLGKKQDIDILAATKTVKVNLLSSVSSNNATVKIGTSAAISVPFKVLIGGTTDITASEVDAQGNALSTATAGVTVDNTNKVVSLARAFAGTAHIKFVPKDASKQGTGVTVNITGAPTETSKVGSMIAGGAVAVGSNASQAVAFANPSAEKTAANTKKDKAAFAFDADSVDSLISTSYYSDFTSTQGAPVTAAKNGDGTNANDVDGIKFTVKNGVPAGTYKGYVSFLDVNIANSDTANDNLLYFQEVNVVVTGSAKDLPIQIGINKINDTSYWTYGGYINDYAASKLVAANGTDWVADPTAAGILNPDGTTSKIETISTVNSGNWSATVGTMGSCKVNGVTYTFKQATDAKTKIAKLAYQSATLLSGVDTTITLTSPIKEAGIVSDIALGSLQVEDAGTGARVSDGFTIDGMSIKIAASALTAGKTYNVYVSTKGTGINESDTMTKTGTHLEFTVQQGYKFNYNLGDAKVKSGKTISEVSISSDDTTTVKLEDGSNIEYTGASFLGWAYTAGATKADISAADAKAGLSKAQIKTSIDKQVNGTIELYGVWDYTTYTMSFDANGGTGTQSGKNFTVAATDMVLPTEGFAKGDKPLVGWTTTSTGKSASGATLPVYTGTLNGSQLQAIVAEVDPTAKTTAIKMYAQYGAALKSVTITPATLDLTVGGATGLVTASATDEDGKAMTTPTITYTSDNTGVATVDANGVVTAVAEGTANITATATLGNVSVTSASACVVTVKAAEEPVVTKKANTLTVKGKTVTVKKGKKTTLKVAKVLTVKNAKGTVTYTKKSGNKKITIKKTTGKVTVKKGLKKGTYKVKVAVKAAGNDSYKAKTVTKTFKIKVK